MLGLLYYFAQLKLFRMFQETFVGLTKFLKAVAVIDYLSSNDYIV